MSVRLLLDEDIHKAAAEQLRLRSYDAVHVVEVGRSGLSDELQLKYAHEENRVILSFNVKDYIKLHESYLKTGRDHSGIILSKQIPIGDLIKKLAMLIHDGANTEFWNTLYFL